MGIAFLEKTRVCQECGRPFIWSADEQEYYVMRGFGHEPALCGECRLRRRDRMPRPPAEYKTICAKCAKGVYVPFASGEGRTAYCRDCFEMELLILFASPSTTVRLNRVTEQQVPSVR